MTEAIAEWVAGMNPTSRLKSASRKTRPTAVKRSTVSSPSQRNLDPCGSPLTDVAWSSRSKPPSSRRSSQPLAWPCWRRAQHHGIVGGWSIHDVPATCGSRRSFCRRTSNLLLSAPRLEDMRRSW